jgi:penicillin-binding protein 1B
MAWEAATWGTGITGGLLVASLALWVRATRDVEAYIAEPPPSVPATVWSAPMQVRAHQGASVSGLAGDLLAAGYERVDHVDGTNQFSVDAGRFDIWTGAAAGAGWRVEEARGTVLISDGYVVQTTPGSLTLRPTVLATVGDLDERRDQVSLGGLSEWMEPALLAMEDSRFRDHAGIDPIGISRAVARNLIGGGHMEGGSTLTQQLAKNLFLTSERRLQRKVREAFFAAALESQLNKDELLELYLGEVYLGQVGGLPIHGVQQAARAWFGVSAQRLTLGQAATIAGVISAPNAYSPTRHPDRARQRRDIVLARMVKVGAINDAQATAARSADLVVEGELPGTVRRAPWAVDAAIDRVESELGNGSFASGGYRIHTTIQPQLQRAAELAVREGMAELDAEYPKASGAEVALVALRASDGAVVAMVGSRSYRVSPFNRATDAWRQPGSTVKPLTMLAAFNEEYALTPISRLPDEPVEIEVGPGDVWRPQNYDGKYLGEVTIREAIESSRNIPAWHLADRVGMSDLETHYERLGLTRASARPSSSLGAFESTPLEMAGAYTVFPGGGTAHRPRLVSGLSDGQNRTVATWDPEPITVASARAAALSVAILEGVITDGTGARAANYGVSGRAGGKTGTTDGYRDAWFVGFTTELVVAVWVGRDRDGSIGLSGSRAALPTWARFVASSGDHSGATFNAPDGLVFSEVCASSHQMARDTCESTYTEAFFDGAVPTDKCDEHAAGVADAIGGLFGFGRKKRTARDPADD